MTSIPAPDPLALREVLRTVHDPEFGVSVEDLGLIYALTCDAGHVRVTMTLTSMYCPAGDVILAGVQSALERVPGVSRVQVELVWSPTWTADRLSRAARQHLGWDEPPVEA